MNGSRRFILSQDTGLLLIGHGTRDERGAGEFLEVAAQVAGGFACAPFFGGPVEPCLLELAKPSIPEAVDRLWERGVQHLLVVPLLLFAAGHVRHDIPAAVADACGRYPELSWQQTPPLECHTKIVNLAEQRFSEAVRSVNRTNGNDGDMLWIMVGRGSRDEQATAEMVRFSQLCAKRVGGEHLAAGELVEKLSSAALAGGDRAGAIRVTTCYCAMAEPLFADTISMVAEAVAAQPGRIRIVVQPHLLFHGQLLADVHRHVDAIRTARPEQIWHVADHLAPAAEIGEALLDIVERSLSIET